MRGTRGPRIDLRSATCANSEGRASKNLWVFLATRQTGRMLIDEMAFGPSGELLGQFWLWEALKRCLTGCILHCRGVRFTDFAVD